MAEKSKLDWSVFDRLPGSPRLRFESLWRTLVRGSYGAYGVFRERINEAGIEFSLKLTKNHSELGSAGDEVAWQCKFPDVIEDSPSGHVKSLVNRSLAKVHVSIKKCFLCTPASKLTTEDDKWTAGLQNKYSFAIEWQIDDDVQRLLDLMPGGNVLREAYFGELALSDDEISAARDVLLAPVKERFCEELYCRGQVDDTLDRYLCRQRKGDSMADYLLKSCALLEKSSLDGGVSDLAREIKGLAGLVRKNFDDVDLWISNCEGAADQLLVDLQDALKRVDEWRASKGEVGRANSVDFIRTALREIYANRLQLLLCVRIVLVGVKADAGSGKTCFAFEHSRSREGECPPGVVFLAKNYTEGSGLDGLARDFHFRSRAAKSFEEILCALNVAGSVRRTRIPIFFDGLNESSNPASWKDVLARLAELVRQKYPYVLIVATLRTGRAAGLRYGLEGDGLHAKAEQDIYVRKCLPVLNKPYSLPVLELPRWRPDLMVGRYFKYYNLKWHGWAVPAELRHPLALSLYCRFKASRDGSEVWLPDQIEDTGEVYELYCKNVAERIAQDDDCGAVLSSVLISNCIDAFARLLYEANTREVLVDQLEKVCALPSGVRKSWGRILSDEGIGALGMSKTGAQFLEPSYDALGGYLIARYLLRQDEAASLKTLAQHPLCEDILRFLIRGWNKRHPDVFVGDAYPDLDKRLLAEILITLPDVYLTESACACVKDQCGVDDGVLQWLLQRILTDFGRTDVPFTASDLDAVLSSLPMARRDKTWGLVIANSIDRLSEKLWADWRGKDEEYSVLCKWLLCSNCTTVRDRASHLIVEIGRSRPPQFLDQVVAAVKINDNYIVERMLAASYAVCQALFSDRKTSNWESLIIGHAEKMVVILLDQRSQFGTSHSGVIDTVVNLVALAKELRIVNGSRIIRKFRFPYRLRKNVFKTDHDVDDGVVSAVDRAIHMNMANYTLTRLVGASPYQTDSEEYKKARLCIEQRMYDLGYRDEAFEDMDRIIDSNHVRYAEDGGAFYFDRVGKKYFNIVLAEMIALRRKIFEPFDREAEDVVDPCFSPEPSQLPFQVPFAMKDWGGDMRGWLTTPWEPDYADCIDGRIFADSDDDWVLVDGYISQCFNERQTVFKFFRGVLAEREVAAAALKSDCDQSHFDARESYYIYQGEFPWSPQLDWEPDETAEWQRICLPQISWDRLHWNADGSAGSGRVERLVWRYECGSDGHESKERIARSAVLPSPYMARILNLRPSYEDWNWRDDSGRLVTRYFAVNDQVIGNVKQSYSLFYVRKDVLSVYAKLRDLSFVRTEWGERNLGIKFCEGNWDFFKKNGIAVKDIEFHKLVAPVLSEGGVEIKIPAEYRAINCPNGIGRVYVKKNQCSARWQLKRLCCRMSRRAKQICQDVRNRVAPRRPLYDASDFEQILASISEQKSLSDTEASSEGLC